MAHYEATLQGPENTTVWKAIRQINERKICWGLFIVITSLQAPAQAVPISSLAISWEFWARGVSLCNLRLLIFPPKYLLQGQSEWLNGCLGQVFIVFTEFFSYVPTFSKASHPEFARLLNKESKDLWLYHPDTRESQHSWCRVSMMSISAIIPARMLLEALCRGAVTDLLPTLPSTWRALGMALVLV